MATHVIPYDSTEPVIRMLSLDEKPQCFFCGDELEKSKRATGEFVYWHGRPDKSICLHPVCAEQLGLHLIQDARSANTKTLIRVRLRPENKLNTP